MNVNCDTVREQANNLYELSNSSMTTAPQSEKKILVRYIFSQARARVH